MTIILQEPLITQNKSAEKYLETIRKSLPVSKESVELERIFEWVLFTGIWLFRGRTIR